MIRSRMTKAEKKARAKARAQARARARVKAEVEARAQAKARAQAGARAKAEVEARAQAKARAQARARAKAEVEARAQAKAEEIARAKAEEMAKAKAEAEEKAKAEEMARAAAEQKAKAEAEEKAKAKEIARAAAEQKAKAEAEEKAKAEEMARAAAEQKAKAKAEEKAKAEVMARAEAEEKARAKAEQKAKAEAAPKKLRIPALKMPSFPTMQIGGRMAEKRIIALSIEGTDLRLVSFYKDSIESWDSVSFNPDLFKMGRVADPEGMGEVIKSALEGREVSQSRLVCAPPGLRAISRVIGMPKLGTRELEIAVPLEGRRLMMVSEEENYLHWQAIPTETDQIQMFVLAVPKEPLLDFMEVLRVAGVKPHALDLKPLALMRTVNQKDAIIANGESNSMELVIGVDDVPVLIRSVFLGEEVVTPDYAVGRISDEIRRTIETYNESNTDNPLDPEVPIYLSGAAAASVPFALNVAALTGRTVQPLEPPIHYPEDFPLAEFMVNVGLILKIL